MSEPLPVLNDTGFASLFPSVPFKCMNVAEKRIANSKPSMNTCVSRQRRLVCVVEVHIA